MAFRVEISAQAERDAEAILDWLLSEHPGHAAIDWFLALDDAFASLAEFPERCPIALRIRAFLIEPGSCFTGGNLISSITVNMGASLLFNVVTQAGDPARVVRVTVSGTPADQASPAVDGNVAASKVVDVKRGRMFGVGTVERSVFVDLSCEEALTQRAICTEADLEFLSCRQYFHFRPLVHSDYSLWTK